MNGSEIYNTAMTLLGYTDSDSGVCLPDSMRQRSLGLIVQLCRELNITEPSTLIQPIQSDQAGCDALCFGLAMLYSLSEGDPEKNRLFTQIYNSKRAGFKGGRSQIGDLLPSVGGGA